MSQLNKQKHHAFVFAHSFTTKQASTQTQTMLMSGGDNDTPDPPLTTYKTRWDSDGVLNEWELVFEKGDTRGGEKG